MHTQREQITDAKDTRTHITEAICDSKLLYSCHSTIPPIAERLFFANSPNEKGRCAYASIFLFFVTTFPIKKVFQLLICLSNPIK